MKALLATIFISFFVVGSVFGQKGEVTVEITNEQSVKKLPLPDYPASAKKAGLQGIVPVQITLDEKGNVINAEASRLYPICPSGITPEIQKILNVSIQSAKKAKFRVSNSSSKEFIRYTFRLTENETKTFNVMLGTTDSSERTVSGGVLDGKAVALPQPIYPAAARAIKATGSVEVLILIKEDGSVFSAEVQSGHPLLRASSEIAACSSKFAPTLLEGNPVKVSGLITYNYIL